MLQEQSTNLFKTIFTEHQSQFWAYYLSLNGSIEQNLTRSIASAKVDLNPHQVEAALFALRSPLSKGVILADEVGLGKTIEASLVISQKWAERRRNILLVVPASLRQQWASELIEKFGISSVILDSKIYKKSLIQNNLDPFLTKDKIKIITYDFAAKMYLELAKIPWDLVVIDEAHKLRNVYKIKQNFVAKKIRQAFKRFPKLLLTATPLQNTLLELYGLVSIIDKYYFGSYPVFKEKYCSPKPDFDELKLRLKNICYRNLRKTIQDEGSINFTKRLPLTQFFTPTFLEHKLHEDLSSFLQRPNLVSFKPNCRHLIDITLRKILASSPQAIIETIKKIVDRLESSNLIGLEELDDYDVLDELSEEQQEIFDDEHENPDDLKSENTSLEIANLKEIQLLSEEIQILKNILEYGREIGNHSKSDALLTILNEAFRKVSELGANRKAVIFTESKRTQQFLFEFLSQNGFESKIVNLNGDNTDVLTKQIYEDWKIKNKHTDKVSGVKASDIKASLVDKFKEDADILICTEAGAEGLNLQFCSLIINYDLPWNPQRIEQRIGRCHRYGQRFDVVVVNLINDKNPVDKHVFDLLDYKFKLFDGVFGSSDEILGVIQSGFDLERKIHEIYKNCRTEQEIEDAFAEIRQDLDDQIKQKELETRKILLENFDDEIVQNLKLRYTKSSNSISQFHNILFSFVQSVLNCTLVQDSDFENHIVYEGEHYYTNWHKASENNGHFLKLGDNEIIDEKIKYYRNIILPNVQLVFDYANYHKKHSGVEIIKNKSGFIDFNVLTLDSLDSIEFLLPIAYSNDEACLLDQKQVYDLMSIPAIVVDSIDSREIPESQSDKLTKDRVKSVIDETNDKNYQIYTEEKERLDFYVNDVIMEIQLEIDQLIKKINELNKEKDKLEVPEKIGIDRKIQEINKNVTELEEKKLPERKKVEAEKESILTKIESKISLKSTIKKLFTIQWYVK